jgi:hypothetical protein
VSRLGAFVESIRVCAQDLLAVVDDRPDPEPEHPQSGAAAGGASSEVDPDWVAEDLHNEVWQALSHQSTIELPLPGCLSPGDATCDDRAQERFKNTADVQTAAEHVIALQAAAAQKHRMELDVAENKLELAEDFALDAGLAAAALHGEHEAAAKAKDDEHVEAKDDEHVEALGGAEGRIMEAILEEPQEGITCSTAMGDSRAKNDLRLLYVQGAERVYMAPREYTVIMKAVIRRIESALVMRLYVNPLNWHCKAFSGKVTPTYDEPDVAVPLEVTPLGNFLRIPVVAAQLQAETGARIPHVFVSTIPASAAAGEARSRKKQQVLCAVVSSYLPEYSEDPILHAELKALTEPHTTGPGKLRHSKCCAGKLRNATWIHSRQHIRCSWGQGVIQVGLF